MGADLQDRRIRSPFANSQEPLFSRLRVRFAEVPNPRPPPYPGLSFGPPVLIAPETEGAKGDLTEQGDLPAGQAVSPALLRHCQQPLPFVKDGNAVGPLQPLPPAPHLVRGNTQLFGDDGDRDAGEPEVFCHHVDASNAGAAAVYFAHGADDFSQPAGWVTASVLEYGKRSGPSVTCTPHAIIVSAFALMAGYILICPGAVVGTPPTTHDSR